MESDVVLSIGVGKSIPEGPVGVGGLDFDLPTRNISKKVGLGDFGFLDTSVGAGPKSAAEGFECAGGRK